MSVNSIDANAQTIPINRNNNSRSTISQDQFLQLLVTELQSQDPLKPMDNSQLSQEITQLNDAKGMADVKASMQQMQASSLVGKYIEGYDINGQPVAGTVNSITNSSGELYLSIGNTYVKLTDVKTVYNTKPTTTPPGGSGGGSGSGSGSHHIHPTTAGNGTNVPTATQ